jgi:hypothetical protein
LSLEREEKTLCWEIRGDSVRPMMAGDRPDRGEAMPRDGSLTLSDIREPTLTIRCERCGRYGRYNVARLIAAWGADAKLTDLLVTLANCEKARSVSRRCDYELADKLDALAQARRPWWRRLVG